MIHDDDIGISSSTHVCMLRIHSFIPPSSSLMG